MFIEKNCPKPDCSTWKKIVFTNGRVKYVETTTGIAYDKLPPGLSFVECPEDEPVDPEIPVEEGDRVVIPDMTLLSPEGGAAQEWNSMDYQSVQSVSVVIEYANTTNVVQLTTSSTTYNVTKSGLNFAWSVDGKDAQSRLGDMVRVRAVGNAKVWILWTREELA